MSKITIDKYNQSITFINNGIGFSQFGVANEILDLIDNQDKEIERLNKQLQLISDEFLKYDWENSSKKQIINQLKSLYNSIFKG